VEPGAFELAAGVRSGMTDRERLLDELWPVSFVKVFCNRNGRHTTIVMIGPAGVREEW
jgi:hypothetical protein